MKKKLFNNYDDKVEQDIEKEIEELEVKKIKLRLKPKFPLHCFFQHKQIKKFVQNIIARGADPNGVGATILFCLSSCIGSGAKVKIEGDPNKDASLLNIWMLINGLSSSGKGRVTDFTLEPLTMINEFIKYEHKDHYYRVDKVTLDTLYTKVFENNPFGIVLNYEEIRIWFEQMKKFGNQAEWLPIHSGKGYDKILSQGRFYATQVFCNIYGETQPAFMSYLFTENRLQDGLSARILTSNNLNEEYVRGSEKFDEIAFDYYKTTCKYIFDQFFYTSKYEIERKTTMYFINESDYETIAGWEKRVKRTEKRLDKEVLYPTLGRLRHYVMKIAAILQIFENSLFDLSIRTKLRVTDMNVAYALEIADYFLECFILNVNVAVDPLCMKLYRAIKQGISLTKFAKVENIDPANLRKKKLIWENEYPQLDW